MKNLIKNIMKMNKKISVRKYRVFLKTYYSQKKTGARINVLPVGGQIQRITASYASPRSSSRILRRDRPLTGKDNGHLPQPHCVLLLRLHPATR